MLLQIPLSWVFVGLKNPTVRLVYSLLLGLGLEIFCYRSRKIIALYSKHLFIEVLHPLILIFMTYFLMSLFNRQSQTKYVFLFTFAYLAYVNVKRMLDDYGHWRADIGKQLTYTIMKLTSLSVCF